MRISIIGEPGSGKSYLAKEISKKFGIKHIELDRFWFEFGGKGVSKHTSQKEKEAIRAKIRIAVEKEIQTDSWVSDGFYTRVQPLISNAADHTAHLKIPLLIRIFNHILRVFSFDRHPELSRLDEVLFIPEIIRRYFANKPKRKKFFDSFEGEIIVLKNRKEIQSYLENLQ